jgi:hypothetical protein
MPQTSILSLANLASVIMSLIVRPMLSNSRCELRISREALGVGFTGVHPGRRSINLSVWGRRRFSFGRSVDLRQKRSLIRVLLVGRDRMFLNCECRGRCDERRD